MIRKYNNNQDKQQSKQQLTTCRHQNKMSTTALKANTTSALATSFEHNNNNRNNIKTATVTMSSLAADLCKVAVAVQPPPMEAVVVNSIIYSKPSFCSIVVDIGGMETTTPSTAASTGPCCRGLGFCNKDKMAEHMTNKSQNTTTTWTDKPFVGTEGYFPAAAAPAPTDDQDAHVYMMCTTMNGSIHHQISELCDNLIAMGLFGMANSSDHDDDSLIEFAYDDEHNLNETDDDYQLTDDDDDDDDDNEDDETDDEDYDYDDACLYACEDVVDFVKSCPIVTKATNEYCDNKKKVQRVRFNTKPVVHVMHTWSYAYRAARKGDWEMYARDRERFKLRIYRAAPVLNLILDREHRQKIYEQRFANLYAEVEEKPKEKPQPKNPNQKKKYRKRKRRRRRDNF